MSSIRPLTMVGALVGALLLPGQGQAALTSDQPLDTPAEATTALVSTTTSSSVTTVPAGMTSYAPAGGAFGAQSEWKRSVINAPLASNSAAMAAGLAQQVAIRYGGVAAFNVSKYNTSFYTVDASVTRHDVVFDDCQGKGYTPPQLYTASAGAHFSSVPIPDDAVPALGTDGELTVWDSASDRYWEFWKAVKQPNGWHACWGGRIDHVSTAPGYFTAGMGASSSGLAVAAGAVGIEEARAGHIDHALSLAIVDTEDYKTWSYPAQRSDGYNPTHVANRIPHGTRLRLDPSVDVHALGLTPVATMVARAAQQYGFIVTDKGGAVAVSAESGAGVKAATGVDPWTQILGGTPSYSVMKGFPWGKLQVLPKDWGKAVTSSAKAI